MEPTICLRREFDIMLFVRAQISRVKEGKLHHIGKDLGGIRSLCSNEWFIQLLHANISIQSIY